MYLSLSPPAFRTSSVVAAGAEEAVELAAAGWGNAESVRVDIAAASPSVILLFMRNPSFGNWRIRTRLRLLLNGEELPV
jgi:hypothetical protein